VNEEKVWAYAMGGGEGEGDGICRKNGKIHDSGSELDQHTKEKCIVVFMHNP